MTLASLRIAADAVIWDIGAGSGAVSIEASMMASRGTVYAIEIDSQCAEYCRDNARAHGADNVVVVEGSAPGALRDLPRPDAVFVGGSKGSMEEIVQIAKQQLRPGGRLVINAITLESVASARDSLRNAGLEPELVLCQVSRGSKLAHYLRYEALNPVHIFAANIPETSEGAHS